jgi:hypothetical protein
LIKTDYQVINFGHIKKSFKAITSTQNLTVTIFFLPRRFSQPPRSKVTVNRDINRGDFSNAMVNQLTMTVFVTQRHGKFINRDGCITKPPRLRFFRFKKAR